MLTSFRIMNQKNPVDVGVYQVKVSTENNFHIARTQFKTFLSPIDQQFLLDISNYNHTIAIAERHDFFCQFQILETELILNSLC